MYSLLKSLAIVFTFQIWAIFWAHMDRTLATLGPHLGRTWAALGPLYINDVKIYGRLCSRHLKHLDAKRLSAVSSLKFRFLRGAFWAILDPVWA